MSSAQEVKTSYFCECTLSITDEVTPQQASETKDNFNSVPSIHEVDEDDDDDDDGYEGNINNSNCVNNITDDTNLKEKEKSSADDEFAYTNESFCSDDSYDESEETTSKYFDKGSCSLLDDDIKEEQSQGQDNSSNQQNQRNCSKDSNESINLEDNTRLLPNNARYTGPDKVRTKRKNMTFTAEEIRKIERDNELLLRKIMAQHQTRDNVFREGSVPKMSSSAINRRRLQKKIEGDNMLLLRRIQQAKPCVIPKSTAPGYRKTFI